MKNKYKKGVCMVMLLVVGLASFVRAESKENQVIIQMVGKTSEVITYNVEVPLEAQPINIWKTSNLRDWTFLTNTTFGLNTFELLMDGPRGFVQGFDLEVNPNFPPVDRYECTLFERNLTLGSEGEDVTILQQFLMMQGLLSLPDEESVGYFGGLTQSALAKYQHSVGISPAVGYFGPITRAYVRYILCPYGETQLNIEPSEGNPDSTFFLTSVEEKSPKYCVIEGILSTGEYNREAFLDEFPFEITTSGGSFDDIVEDATLEVWRDRVLVLSIDNYESEEISPEVARLEFFAGYDRFIKSGDRLTFKLNLEFKPSLDGGNYQTGATISACVKSSENRPENPYNVTGYGWFDIVGNGFVQGATHTIGTSVGDITNVSWSTSETDTTGIIDLFFSVTAEEDDFDVLATDIVDAATGVAFTNTAGTPETAAFGILSRVSGDTVAAIGATGFTVSEGDTTRFRVRYQAAGAGAYEVSVDSIAGQELEDDEQLSPTVILE